ncbi:MAG TPA: rhomboid family intramembrane serine protease [Streptosporangiaceae bacterium]|jgi:membrane associated rhomboid family serine protease
MRDASVGQQCVECVKEGNRDVRPARNVFGGRASSPQAGTMVTYALIAINVVLFLIELARPSLADSWEMLGHAYIAYPGPPRGVAAGEWYRLLTSAFLPPAVNGPNGSGTLGLMDIVFNMYALFIVGPSLERMFGGVRFLAIYLLSALGGSVLYYYVAAPNAPALGASGAVFGLFAAWFIVARRLRVDARGVVILIVINLVLGFVVPRIAWEAHIGGLLTGALITAAYAYAPRKYRIPVQIVATVIVLGLAIVAVVLRTHQLTS